MRQRLCKRAFRSKHVVRETFERASPYADVPVSLDGTPGSDSIGSKRDPGRLVGADPDQGLTDETVPDGRAGQDFAAFAK